MDPIEALKLALSKETETEAMYQKFSGDYPIAKDIFAFLANEEQKHKKLIGEKIQELTK